VVADYRERVLRPYHEELCAALGSADAYPYEQLETEFEDAGLDYFRWVVCARLNGFTPAKLAAAAAPPGDINRGMYIRSVPRLVWLLRRTHEFLGRAEGREPRAPSA
jgi:hypothetical protein